MSRSSFRNDFYIDDADHRLAALTRSVTGLNQFGLFSTAAGRRHVKQTLRIALDASQYETEMRDTRRFSHAACGIWCSAP
jgi:hypothetical protein